MRPGEMEQCWVRSHISVPPGVRLGDKQNHLRGSLEPVHSEQPQRADWGERVGHGQRAQCPVGHSHVSPSVCHMRMCVCGFIDASTMPTSVWAAPLGHCGLLCRVWSIWGEGA